MTRWSRRISSSLTMSDQIFIELNLSGGLLFHRSNSICCSCAKTLFHHHKFIFLVALKTKSPTLARRAFWGCKSLTMSYFHTGIRTIIGADAFHCPVRDGKEWYHVAMVIRHNLYKYWQSQYKKFIEQISCILNASLGITTLNIAVSKL